MLVIGFGTYNTARHPRAGILLQGLAELGADIIEFNEPLIFSTSERVEMMRRPTMASRLSVEIIRSWSILGRRWLRWVWTSRRNRAQRGRPAPDVVLVGYLGHFDVMLARVLFPRTLLALDMLVFARDTAIDRRVTSTVKLTILGLIDRLAMSVADIVILDTEQNAELVPRNYRRKIVVLPVGASDEWFHAGSLRNPPRQLQGEVRLSLVFFGLFTPLQGTPILASAIQQLADTTVTLTMIGSGQDYTLAQELLNNSITPITWIDWVDPVDLPALISRFDVCLGIFGDSPKARRVVPNKVYQGAAAGCAIITSDTAPQRRALGTAALYVTPGNTDSLVSAIRHLAEHPDQVARLQELAATRSQEAFRPTCIAAPLFDAIPGTSAPNREQVRAWNSMGNPPGTRNA